MFPVYWGLCSVSLQAKSDDSAAGPSENKAVEEKNKKGKTKDKVKKEKGTEK